MSFVLYDSLGRAYTEEQIAEVIGRPQASSVCQLCGRAGHEAPQCWVLKEKAVMIGWVEPGQAVKVASLGHMGRVAVADTPSKKYSARLVMVSEDPDEATVDVQGSSESQATP